MKNPHRYDMHFARPLPAGPDAPKFEIYARPFVCAVCGDPIKRVWRHEAAQPTSRHHQGEKE